MNLTLSRKCVEVGRIGMPVTNFNQPWHYPESAYEPYCCVVTVEKAVELLRADLDDVFFAMRESVEDRIAVGKSVSAISVRLCEMGWPRWSTLPDEIMAEVLAEESAMDILLQAEMKYASLSPIAQLRTIDEARARRHRIVIVGRALRYQPR